MSPTRNALPANKPNRPFTTRSVIASTLLGTHPPTLPATALIRSCAMFGIQEGTVRVALTRMVATGELTTSGDGRYELAGHLRQRQSRQDQSRAGVSANEWDGQWEMAVIDATEARSAAVRAELRGSFSRLRLGELREGVWLRPTNLDPKRMPEDRTLASESARWFVSRAHDSRETAQRLWDTVGWASQAKALLTQLQGETKILSSSRLPSELATAFTLNADVLRHFQADALLPNELLPQNWPGARLREKFELFDALFQERWRTWMVQSVNS
jgi:phenylacetic acid degradation operon negative regulatory protein